MDFKKMLMDMAEAQADKMKEAIPAMRDIIENMPVSEEAIPEALLESFMSY